jgi:hypothetical protein
MWARRLSELRCQEKARDNGMPFFPETLEVKIGVTEWVDAERNGDRTQKEPTKVYMSVLDALSRLEDHTKETLEHVVDDEWAKTGKKRKEQTFKPSEIVVLSDFSATPKLEAQLRANCSEANHCILCIFVVLHSPRDVTIRDADGKEGT